REAIRDSRTLLAFMGGVERRGNWSPGKKNVVMALMGGADLDFREVALPPGETEVFIFAMMGGVDIVVPPDLNVDASGIAIMGGFGHASSTRNPDPAAPVLRINGFCFMGGVDISVRRRGESAKDARQREKEERRRLRDEQRRLRGGG
ncbi:MAG TPA: LiaF domain-containing protein, partial [Longimicrobiales bacterium]|nr:LiaF domain-containing protein [Longimicrobiales bacterium]